MPLINVNHASSLTTEQIEALMVGLTDVYTSVTHSNPGAVHVLVQQVPSDRWSVGGESLSRRNSQPA
ncbi:tautomerase family protein [Rhodococcus sp. OK302]|uniref:tautomerase family protein n=1 Tax=Rhodococcus sp. OK302 TaxID=1882769 RepID=UPI000B9432C7|nr:tautomerase family protein [Rhodococcus sp. OK302]OYD61182.1 4-oxalocrotonate tautomerase [Rhodococcus sp. OK302]